MGYLEEKKNSLLFQVFCYIGSLWKKKFPQYCYIKCFVILDLFVSSFHCIDIMSNMANIIEDVIDYFHNT